MFVLLYKLLFQVVVAPLGGVIWAFALNHSPVQYITSGNVLSILKSPLIILAVLILGIGLALWTLFEIAAILICLDAGIKGERIKIWELIRRSAARITRGVYPKNWIILVFAAVIVPFTDVVMVSDFISQLIVPEYIAEVILDTPLYTVGVVALMAVLVILTVRWLFVFHGFVLEEKDFFQAARESGKLIKGKGIKSFVLLMLWKLRIYVKYALIFAVPIGLVMLWMYLGSTSVHQAAHTLVFSMIMKPAIQYLMGCMLTFCQYAYISTLYYRYKEEAGEFQGEFPEEYQKKAHRYFACFLALVMFCVNIGLVYLFGDLIEDSRFMDNIVEARAEVTSHRGYSAKAPENTLPAFQAAIDTGETDYAELDVQQTKDGVVVLTHDTNLKRCTGENVNVYDITYEELQKLDAGSHFGEEFKDTRIPTLDEVIKLCKGKIKLNVEIKNNGHSPTLEEETVRIIRENGFEKDCVITSLSYESLKKVKEIAPELKTGYIMALCVGNYYDLEAADFFSVETTFVTPTMVKELHQRNKEVHVWTVDEKRDAEKMIRMNVDNIITGNPELIYECINNQPQRLLSILSPDGSIDDLLQYISPNLLESIGTEEETNSEAGEEKGPDTLDEILEEA